MRILLAEDDSELANGLALALRQSGYAVDRVSSGTDADAALLSAAYDLLVLDLSLPELDGFDVLARLRARKQPVLVLILTARDEIENRIRGLDLGADDYVTKPFVLGELEARIRALTRRARGESALLIRCGPLALDTVGQRVLLDGRPLDLTQREFNLLAVLVRRCGQVVSKDYLFEQMYDWDSQAGLSAIEVFVSRVRKKIEPVGMTIRVVRGLGYLLELPEHARDHDT